MRRSLFSSAKCLCYCHKVSVREVNTQEALATSFNTKQEYRHDFWNKNIGLFGVQQLNTPEGFIIAKDKAIEDGWKILDKAISCKPGKETVVLFDELSDTLCKVADLADFIRSAHPDKAFAEAANEAHISIGTMVEELNTHPELHNAIFKVVNDKNVLNSLDDVTQIVAKLFLFDFEISGVHLESSKRSKAVKLHEEILHLTSDLLQGASTGIAVPKSMLPQNLLNVFNGDSKSENIYIDGLHANNPNEHIREAAYRIYLYKNQKQEELLKRLLEARYELSNLVGYKTFSDRALKSTMAKTPENVDAFLDYLSSKLLSFAKKDFDKMLQLKIEENNESTELYPWDLHYYSSLLKSKSSSFDTSTYNVFFSLGDCMEGLNLLCQNIFGISLEPEAPGKGEVWSPDIIKLAVKQNTLTIGHIYCDFFHRQGKPQQDCHFTIRGGRLNRDGSYQTPIVVLLLHLPPPTASSPTLLPPGAVGNLFHEAGHALHSMIARTEYQHVTGTRCSTDFAEVPSILMEYFANDERVLSLFAKHYQTREPLPLEMMIDIKKGEQICAASDLQTQVFYSILDQAYHDVHPLPNTLQDIYSELHNKHNIIKHVPGSAWYLRFSHLVSYGSKYYSYLMSRAVAARIWNKCFKDDPLNSIKGQQYKNKMLSHGGGKDPTLMYEDMLNEKFDMKVLADTLVSEIE